LTGYEKYKFIVKRFLKNIPISAKSYEFTMNDISVDTVQNIFTELKQANVIFKNDKENNKLNTELVNKNIFFNDDYNANIISSIISREEKPDAGNTINYVFKEIPQKIYNELSINYSSKMNEILLKYIDESRYIYFSKLIENNDDNFVCEMEISSTFNKKKLLIPKKLFFHDSKLYLLSIDYETNKVNIIDSSKIYSSKLTNDKFLKNINNIDINDEIYKFIFDLYGLYGSITVWITPELLNNIMNMELIDDLEILEKKEFAVFHNSVQISEETLEILRKERIEKEASGTKIFDFHENNFLKVKISSKKVNLILIKKLFDIEIINDRCLHKTFISYFFKKLKKIFFEIIKFILSLSLIFIIYKIFIQA
jgi:hypothetical protein